MIQLFKMAFRDLGRNKRRSLLSSLAVSVGLSLLVLMASVLEGEMRGAMQNSIRLYSAHIQVRAESYEENKVSLAWEDLLESPVHVAEQIAAIPQVSAASPRLFASGIVTLGENSKGVQVIGFDPSSPTSDPIREGVVKGEFLSAEDHEGILIGLPLANKLGLSVGDRVTLLVNTSSGEVDEQSMTVRGIYSTSTMAYDEGTVFLPLAKAQAFTGTGDRASTIFIMLKDRDQAEAVAQSIENSASGYQAKTWLEMNELIVQMEDYAGAYMTLIYLIVLGITATVVTNTLVMAVFERTREIGILSAIGMKARRVMAMFLAEGALIATGGVIGGMILGSLLVAYMAKFGFFIGNMGISGVLINDRIYAYFTLDNTIYLAVLTYVITLIASLYPAALAARMEPVQALHGSGE